LNHKQTEEPHEDVHNETVSSSSSRKSSRANIEFTVDSLDTIRTIGTGKKIEFVIIA
jgi:hypothetical protein